MKFKESRPQVLELFDGKMIFLNKFLKILFVFRFIVMMQYLLQQSRGLLSAHAIKIMNALHDKLPVCLAIHYYGNFN